MLGTAQCQSAPLNGGTSIFDLGCATEKHVGWREIAERLMVALLIVVFDEGGYSLLQLPGKIVMLQANHVFNGTVIPLDFALGLWMIGRTARMCDTVAFQIGR